jgi:D-sedoheptulose 7-phosphate isomerase
MNEINELADLIIDAHLKGNKVLACGNGGLCAESEHFSAELVGKYAFDEYVPCISLTSNTCILTAIANDIGYAEVFAHQVKVMGKPQDILIAMTTSRSLNILNAINAGKQNGLVTVAICSRKSGLLYSDFAYRMSGDDVAEIQNNTIQFLHKVAYEVKRNLNAMHVVSPSF